MTSDGAAARKVIAIYCDGGARGNPGPAAVGAVVLDPTTSPPTRLATVSERIGVATNNVAEYSGLIGALAWAAANGISRLQVRADSDLLVKQMRGEYRVKSPGLQPLFQQARALARQVGHVTFEHVRRELNEDADRLANEAMDEAATRT